MNNEIRSYNNKSVIFKKGDLEFWMYDILEGKVGIYADYGTPAEKELTVLLPGQFFGEMGMIERLPRSATAVALENKTQLRKIDESEFEQYFSGKTEKLMEIMQHMSYRIRSLTYDYISACKALNDTVEGEADEKKKLTFKEKFKKFIEAHFSFSDFPYYFDDDGFMSSLPGHRWELGGMDDTFNYKYFR